MGATAFQRRRRMAEEAEAARSEKEARDKKAAALKDHSADKRPKQEAKK